MMQKLKNDALWCKSAKNLAICIIYEASINLWCDLTTLKYHNIMCGSLKASPGKNAPRKIKIQTKVLVPVPIPDIPLERLPMSHNGWSVQHMSRDPTSSARLLLPLSKNSPVSNLIWGQQLGTAPLLSVGGDEILYDVECIWCKNWHFFLYLQDAPQQLRDLGRGLCVELQTIHRF